MNWIEPSDDYKPVFWVSGYPVYVTTALVFLHCFTMILCTFLLASGHSEILDHLVFSSTHVWSDHEFWQLGTYVFVNGPSIWFAVEMLLLYRFGREVEQFIGRRNYLQFYAALVLVPTLILTAVGGWRPTVASGSGGVHLAVFLAFATIYPNVEFIFGILAKWVAAILLAIYTLQYLAANAFYPLLTLWISAGIAYFGMRLVGVAGGIGWWESFWENRRLSREAQKRQIRIVRQEEQQQSIDDILGKISRQGMGSLTLREKEALEAARKELLAKDRKS